MRPSAPCRSAGLATSTASTAILTPAAAQPVQARLHLGRSRPGPRARSARSGPRSTRAPGPGPARPRPSARLISTTSVGPSGNSPAPGVSAGTIAVSCARPAVSITSSRNRPGSAAANRRAARSPSALSGTRSTVIPSSGCSACRLAQNPVNPGPCVTTTSCPLPIASWAAASATAPACGLAGSLTMASARPAAGSSRKSSLTNGPNDSPTAARTRQGPSSAGGTGSATGRSSSMKQRAHGPTPATSASASAGAPAVGAAAVLPAARAVPVAPGPEAGPAAVPRWPPSRPDAWPVAPGAVCRSGALRGAGVWPAEPGTDSRSAVMPGARAAASGAGSCSAAPPGAGA